jgi:hypothetical protein
MLTLDSCLSSLSLILVIPFLVSFPCTLFLVVSCPWSVASYHLSPMSSLAALLLSFISRRSTFLHRLMFLSLTLVSCPLPLGLLSLISCQCLIISCIYIYSNIVFAVSQCLVSGVREIVVSRNVWIVWRKKPKRKFFLHPFLLPPLYVAVRGFGTKCQAREGGGRVCI